MSIKERDEELSDEELWDGDDEPDEDFSYGDDEHDECDASLTEDDDDEEEEDDDDDDKSAQERERISKKTPRTNTTLI